MKFIIHSLKLQTEAEELETFLGEKCYIPGRDTPQTQGDAILRANLEAMMVSDVDVYVVWDGSSMGTLFDMGMAYALGRTIHPYKLAGNRSWPDFFQHKLGKTIRNH